MVSVIKNREYYFLYIDLLEQGFLNTLFTDFESLLFYKYCILKKGYIKNDGDGSTHGTFLAYLAKYTSLESLKYCSNSKFISIDMEPLIQTAISIEEFEYIYKIYFLILKNVLHFIWSYELYKLECKMQLTQFKIDENNHIYWELPYSSDDTYNYSDSSEEDEFKLEYDEISYNLSYVGKEFDEIHYDKYEFTYETIFILINIINSTDSDLNIKYESNKVLKVLNAWVKLTRKKLHFNNMIFQRRYWYLEDVYYKEFKSDLNSVLAEIKKDWEKEGCSSFTNKNKNKNKAAFLDLIKLIK